MKVKTSKNFKRQTTKTIYSIILFFIVYLLLLTGTLGLVGISFYIAYILISFTNAFPIIRLGLGLAIIACACTILIYLVKFVFSSSKTDLSHLIKITEEEEPQLFALINEIVIKVGTKLPQHVYLSYEVNASVFYNSTFWSMFLPVRKNLQIGVGLINSVSKQELKAILAHEFGHFSQQSMKVGSFVYNLNLIIYNMLYKNESLDKMNENWASINGYAVIFIGISAYIIKGIQKILQILYAKINLNYMALSREMEFHADEIAANVAGSLALSESLLRLQFANNMLNNVLEYYDGKINQSIKSRNIYEDQSALTNLYAFKNRYPLREGLPIITLEHINRYMKSKLNISDQWASHPSEEDRINALNKINIQVNDIDNSSAKNILNIKNNIAKRISDSVFEKINYPLNPTELTTEDFLIDYTDNFDKNSFSPLYNQYFNFTNPVLDNVDLTNTDCSTFQIDELFEDKQLDKLFEFDALTQDKATLEAINNGSLNIKTFDYEGSKYKKNQATDLLLIINNSIKKIETEIKIHKIEIFRYFYNLAKTQNKEELLFKLYNNLNNFDQETSNKIKFHSDFLSKTSFIFEQTAYEAISTNFIGIRKDEKTLKYEINQLLQNDKIIKEMDTDTIDKLKHYIENDFNYFNAITNQYNEKNLEVLFFAIDYYQQLNAHKYFYLKKELLDFQVSLTEISTIESQN